MGVQRSPKYADIILEQPLNSSELMFFLLSVIVLSKSYIRHPVLDQEREETGHQLFMKTLVKGLGQQKIITSFTIVFSFSTIGNIKRFNLNIIKQIMSFQI